jgi:hypothetical protein
MPDMCFFHTKPTGQVPHLQSIFDVWRLPYNAVLELAWFIVVLTML